MTTENDNEEEPLSASSRVLKCFPTVQEDKESDNAEEDE